jgi:Putative Flp pilus-assembly TadE/G-like
VRGVADLKEQDGAVIVLVGLLMPFILLLLAFAVEIGNWYVHKRHLQVQVDAAALAAGQHFGECLTAPGGAEGNMEATGSAYGGATYNEQVGGAAGKGALTLWFQRNTYPPGVLGPDDTVNGGDACSSGMFDVKATESGIPHLFVISPLATVRAHARVELRLLTEMKGLLPIAVPDVRFNYAFATFIDESTGNPPAGCPGSCTEQLSKSGTSGGQQLWTAQSPIAVPVAGAHIGVRLRLVGGPDPNAGCTQLFTECYDALSSGGIVHVRGWSSGNGVHAENVWLLTGSCSPDAYFTKSDCSAGIQGELDLGNHPVSGTDITTNVWASVDGGGKYPLTPGTGTSGVITWTALGGLPISGPGGHQVSLGWDWEQTSGTWDGNSCTTKNNNPCKANGTFGYVQRAYVGDVEGSGPVQKVQVFESGGASSGANSFAQGSTHTLGVSIATTGTLLTQSQATDPVIHLRVTGSQNQSIDCDPATPNLHDEIVKGCAPTYAVNQSLACPGYNELWGTPEPWKCVKTQTGGAVGQVEQGLKDRILGGSNACTAPINWPNYSQDDKRIIPLIITPFGSFSGSGNDIVPVIDFGAFYVVGWNGDPCPGAVPVPKKGYIAGHFIKYIPRNPVASGDIKCDLTDPTQLAPCAAVLTR